METLINKTLTKVTEVEAPVNSKVESFDCKSRDRVLDKDIGSLEASLEFTSSSLEDLKSTQGKDREDEKAEISPLRKEFAYLEAYSRREIFIVVMDRFWKANH